MLSTPKKKVVFIILAAVILVSAVFLGWRLARNSSPADDGIPAYSTDAVDWDEELEGEEPKQGYITMPGYDTIPLKAGNTTAEVALANPESNTCYFQFQLILQDTEEVLYTSDLVAPGKAVVSEELSRSFEAGDYPLIVRINTFSADGKTSYNGSDIVTTLHVFKA